MFLTLPTWANAETILTKVLIPQKQEIAHLAVGKKVSQTIQSNPYTPPPPKKKKQANAHLNRPLLKKGLPVYGSVSAGWGKWEKKLQEGSIPTSKIAKHRRLRVEMDKISSKQLRKSNRLITVKLQKNWGAFCSIYPVLQKLTYMCIVCLGTGDGTKTGEFSEKFQMAIAPSPSFSKYHIAILFQFQSLVQWSKICNIKFRFENDPPPPPFRTFPKIHLFS